MKKAVVESLEKVEEMMKLQGCIGYIGESTCIIWTKKSIKGEVWAKEEEKKNGVKFSSCAFWVTDDETAFKDAKYGDAAGGYDTLKDAYKAVVFQLDRHSN